MNTISAQTASIDYLSLLTVQLQNQDPIDPVDQESLIKDLTQFSMLEGIENLNVSFEQMLKMQEVTQGINLVGKTVEFVDPDTEQVETGQVSELVAGEELSVVIDDSRQIPFENIQTIRNV